VVTFLIPPSGQISLVLRFALLGFFVFHPWKVSRGDVEEPHLVGPAATIGALRKRIRRILVVGRFLLLGWRGGRPPPAHDPSGRTWRSAVARDLGGENNDRRDSRA
jgi:hypothetical protein